jgi:hypothetical protein
MGLMGFLGHLEPACFMRNRDYLLGHPENGGFGGVTGVGQPNQGLRPTEVTHMSEKAKDRTLYVQIPTEIHLAAKMFALAHGRLLGDVVAEALREYVVSGNVGGAKQAIKPAPVTAHPTQARTSRSGARTGPGSPGYVPPSPKVPDIQEIQDEDDAFPPATDEDDPFDDSVLE